MGEPTGSIRGVEFKNRINVDVSGKKGYFTVNVRDQKVLTLVPVETLLISG